MTLPIVVGIDEAGRGPVIGPMVYAAAFCPVNVSLETSPFKDSKGLTRERREEVFGMFNNYSIGYVVRVLSAAEISASMFSGYNLNAQSQDAAAGLIRELCAEQIAHVYVDTVGTPSVYQRRLEGLFPGVEITVAKRADVEYRIVGAASIAAKVTRDAMIDKERGSGYPGDPNTIDWLRENMDPVFGWDSQVRFSWGTAERMLEKGVCVQWTL